MKNIVVILLSMVVGAVESFAASSDQFIKKKEPKTLSLPKMKDALCAEYMVPVSLHIPDLIAHAALLEKDMLAHVQQYVSGGELFQITTKEQVLVAQKQLASLIEAIENLTVQIQTVREQYAILKK